MGDKEIKSLEELGKATAQAEEKASQNQQLQQKMELMPRQQMLHRFQVNQQRRSMCKNLMPTGVLMQRENGKMP